VVRSVTSVYNVENVVESICSFLWGSRTSPPVITYVCVDCDISTARANSNKAANTLLLTPNIGAAHFDVVEINAVGGERYSPVSVLKYEPAPLSKLIYSKYKNSTYYFKPIRKDRLDLDINEYQYNQYTVDGEEITEYIKTRDAVSFMSYIVKTGDVIKELKTYYGGGRRKQTRSKSKSKKQTISKSKSKKQTRSKTRHRK
jgi:hypothetical protein